MCFSATASFIAGSVLVVPGIGTFAKAKKRARPLASIPFLFGAQQFIDGVVWVTQNSSLLHTVAVYAYSALAFSFWPVFTPLAVLLIETDHVRRRILTALAIIGGGVSAFFLYALVVHGARAEVLHNCIAYATPHPYGITSLAFYLVAVSGPFFVSRSITLRVFGAVLLISFGIAGWFYQETFSSTWCFFAATLSGILLFYFYRVSPSERRFRG